MLFELKSELILLYILIINHIHMYINYRASDLVKPNQNLVTAWAKAWIPLFLRDSNNCEFDKYVQNSSIVVTYRSGWDEIIDNSNDLVTGGGKSQSTGNQQVYLIYIYIYLISHFNCFIFNCTCHHI
jgi:hypothetical protein